MYWNRKNTPLKWVKDKRNFERPLVEIGTFGLQNIEFNIKTGIAAARGRSESFGHYSAPKRILWLSLTDKPYWFLQVKSTVLLGANSMSKSLHFRLGVLWRKIYSQKGSRLIKFSMANFMDHIEESETKWCFIDSLGEIFVYIVVQWDFISLGSVNMLGLPKVVFKIKGCTEDFFLLVTKHF